MGEEGISVFDDVFRRMDKNDDGKIQLSEFLSFFEDDLVDDNDLKEMFDIIDENKDGTLSLEELTNWFKGGFQAYVPIFSALLQMNKAVSASLHASAQDYPQDTYIGKFKTRFYLREILLSLESLHQTIQVAVDFLEKQTEVHRKHTPLTTDHDVAAPIDTSTTMELSALRASLERLAKILPRMTSPRLITPESKADHAELPEFVVTCSEMRVVEGQQEEFLRSLRAYVDETQEEAACYHVYVKEKIQSFAVYEIWESDAAMDQHYLTHHYKEYTRRNVDFLSRPPAFNSMRLPASWWPAKK